MFDAARRFAKEAYPSKEFPNLDADDPCPLCQEPLEGGLERVKDFDEFVRNEAEKNVRACRKALAEKYKPFESLFMELGYDEPLRKEIEGLEKLLAVEIGDFEKSILARHKAILTACKDRKWDVVPDEPKKPAGQLMDLAKGL